MRRSLRAGGLLLSFAALGAASAAAEIVHAPGDRSRGYEAFLDFTMEGGVDELEAAVVALGESSFLAVEQAQAAGRRGEEGRMVERASRAVELDRDNIEAHALLARLSFRGVAAGLSPGESLEERAIGHAEEYLRLGGRDGEMLAALTEAWRLRARRATAQGEPVKARDARRRQREVLEAWVDRTHDLRAYERLHDLADETLDFEADIPYLRAHVQRLPPDRRLPLVHLLSRRLEVLGRCEEALPLLRQAASAESLHPHDEAAVSVRLGRCANEAGRPDLAEPALERALELDPTNDRVAQDLASALWALGRRGEAQLAWDAHVERAVRKAAVLERRARWEHAVDLSDEALRHLAQALAVAQEESASSDGIASLHLQRAEVLFDLGRVEDALVEADAASALMPDESAAVLLRADLLWARGRHQAAIDLLDEFARDLPRSSPFFGERAIWDVGKRRWREAVRGARRYLQTAEASESVSAQELLVRQRRAASVLINAGRLGDAEAVLQAALDRAPSPPLFEREFVFLLADVMVARGRLADAQDLLSGYEAVTSRNAYYLETRVAWDIRHQRREDALAHAREALERAGRDGSGTGMERARFEALLGEAWLAQAEPEKAIEFLQRALAHPGVHPTVRHLLLARALLDAERLEEAHAVLVNARGQHPESFALARELGRVLLRRGEFEEGAKVLRGELDGVRWSAGLVQRLALDLSFGGAHDAARSLIDEALAQSPADADLWITAGTLLDQAGQKAESEEAFRRAIELEPDHASALNSLGYTLATQGRKLEEAVRLVRKALDIRPDEGSYLDSLGWALLKRGELDGAAEALEAAAARDRDPVIVMHLGTLRETQGRLREALELYHEALRFGLTEDVEQTRQRVRDLEARLAIGAEDESAP
jgi:tetratricopeptide (TPR) repeat protein